MPSPSDPPSDPAMAPPPPGPAPVSRDGRLADATSMGAVELLVQDRRTMEDFYVRGVGLSPLAAEPGRTVLGLPGAVLGPPPRDLGVGQRARAHGHPGDRPQRLPGPAPRRRRHRPGHRAGAGAIEQARALPVPSASGEIHVEDGLGVPQLEEHLVGPALGAGAQEQDVGGRDEGEGMSGHGPTLDGRRRGRVWVVLRSRHAPLARCLVR